MNTNLAALASTSLLAVLLALSPTLATARGGGGFHGGGGFPGGAGGVRDAGFRGNGFRDHGFHDGGFRDGGFRGRGFGDRGFRGGFFADDFLFDDAFLGLAFADAGFYDDLGFYGAYAYGPPYPSPPSTYDDGASAGPSAPQYQSQWDQAQPRQACGSWVWSAAQYKYNWTSC